MPSGSRATIPRNLYVHDITYVEGPSNFRHNIHFVTTSAEPLQIPPYLRVNASVNSRNFDGQRRSDSNRRVYHPPVEEVVDDNSDYEVESSSEEFYQSCESDGSNGSDETAYAEAQEYIQDQVPQRSRPGSRTHEQARDDDTERRMDANKPLVNYYERLGIQRGATEDEIKRAAKKMRVQVHPHRLITTATSEEEKKVINQKAGEVGEAAEVLLNPSTREKHDEELRQRERNAVL